MEIKLPDVQTPETETVSNLTTTIVAAYVQRNQVNLTDIPDLIQSVYSALNGLGQATTLPAETLKPAVPIRKSIQPDYLVCLEDGKKMKMLKRHLTTAYGMTADQYRQRWNLPADYPMVAPKYAEQRSALAKKIGLGTRARRGAASVPAPPAAKKGGRGRRKAAA